MPEINRYGESSGLSNMSSSMSSWVQFDPEVVLTEEVDTSIIDDNNASLRDVLEGIIPADQQHAHHQHNLEDSPPPTPASRSERVDI